MNLKSCLSVLFLAIAFSHPTKAEDDGTKTELNIKEPSPDGRFAFLETVVPKFHEEGTVDLIEQKSQKVLRRVVDAINVSWSAHWAPDSQHFVVVQRPGHAIQGIDVYARRGATFQEVKLPELEANVPKRLTRGKEFPHFSELSYETMGKWTSHRTFTLEIGTYLDGAGTSVSATRNVLLGFAHNGKIKILKSKIRYESQDQ